MDYDLNNLVSIRLEEGLLPSINGQYSYWKSEGQRDAHDLIIAKGAVRSTNLIRASNDYSFFDGGFVRQEQRGQIEYQPGKITIDGFVDESRVEAKFIMPSINQILLKKGWCLAHASAVVYQGKAILFPAMGGTGKTSIMLEFLSRGADYMGDDHIMVSEHGNMALFPRWIHMMEYNWSLFPELFGRAFPDIGEKRRQEKKLRKYRMGLRIKGGNPATRYLKNYYTSYYYYDARIQPEMMFPDSKIVLRSKVKSAYFLERSDSSQMIIDSSPSRMARLTVGSSEMERVLFPALCHLAGIDSLDYSHSIDCMKGFFEQAHCYEVQLNEIRTRNDASKVVDELISHLD